MATFAHLVGFNQDYKTVMHMHPKGAPSWTRLRAADRSWSFRFIRCSPALFVFSLKCRLKAVHVSLLSASRSCHEFGHQSTCDPHRIARRCFPAVAAVLIAARTHDAAGRKLREAILAELQPVALKNCTLKRFGSANDGGYLMCENLIEPLDTGYSYGVGTNDDWACEVSRRYHVPVHEYDCFDPARPICDGGRFVFHNECVGNRTGNRDSRFFDTLENQISKNGDTGGA